MKIAEIIDITKNRDRKALIEIPLIKSVDKTADKTDRNERPKKVTVKKHPKNKKTPPVRT